MNAKEILKKSENIVNGERRESYGHPSENHGCTASFWSAYLSRKLRMSVQLDVRDVCQMNILQKISRDANMKGEDNVVDTIGYALNIAIDEDYQADGAPFKNEIPADILTPLPIAPVGVLLVRGENDAI